MISLFCGIFVDVVVLDLKLPISWLLPGDEVLEGLQEVELGLFLCSWLHG